MKSPKFDAKVAIPIAVLAVAVSTAGYYFTFFEEEGRNAPFLGDVHEHADFAVYLNGERFDFAQEKYMSNSERALSNFMHLHDMDGEVMHKHISDADVGFFFFTIGMKFNSTCFVTDEKTAYCEDEENELKMFVNGAEEHRMDEYIFNDLDQILITYGSGETVINQQLQSVTDRACIQSGKCPERGEPFGEYTCLSEEGCIVEGP